MYLKEANSEFLHSRTYQAFSKSKLFFPQYLNISNTRNNEHNFEGEVWEVEVGMGEVRDEQEQKHIEWNSQWVGENNIYLKKSLEKCLRG